VFFSWCVYVCGLGVPVSGLGVDFHIISTMHGQNHIKSNMWFMGLSQYLEQNELNGPEKYERALLDGRFLSLFS
jgi:hypothetical protein